MKNIIFLILFFKILLISCQDKTNLYLIFKKEKKNVSISISKDLNNLKIYSFVTKNSKNQKDVLYFSSLTLEEEEKYSKSNGKYKVKAIKDTLNLKEIKKYNLKSYKWLKEEMKKNIDFYKVEKKYEKIFIVELDSINNKAILTEVQHVEIID
ncbi:hypothetical protein [Polaribacter cellanae]|uniref:Uncharacterized protein n=1 Tax=Polaribacter cellanae TaxID=2818493 RepID=A0A975CL98_9FLAO|nr:hypothetical protein [Polaribacter cellanae]QTE21310.1 hypothetical protein J3359_10765 [Polaribacter cellanae]